MPETLTADALYALFDDEQSQRAVLQWVAIGKKVAVYRNEDLGHPECGHVMAVSFGTKDSFFGEEPPEQMPDFPSQINWRYRLYGTYRPES